MAKYNIEMLAVIDADSYDQASEAAEALVQEATEYAEDFNTDGRYGHFTTPVTVEAIGDNRYGRNARRYNDKGERVIDK